MAIDGNDAIVVKMDADNDVKLLTVLQEVPTKPGQYNGTSFARLNVGILEVSSNTCRVRLSMSYTSREARESEPDGHTNKQAKGKHNTHLQPACFLSCSVK